MSKNLVHAAGLKRIESCMFSGAHLAESFKTLASLASDSNAASSDFAFRYVASGEDVTAKYVPVIILRLEPPPQD